MAKYIDADKIRENAVFPAFNDDKEKQRIYKIGFYYAMKCVERAEAEDVAPVRHGKWLGYYDDDDKIICSECKTYWYKWDDCEACIEGFVYCPNCGAKMDGEEIK